MAASRSHFPIKVNLPEILRFNCFINPHVSLYFQKTHFLLQENCSHLVQYDYFVGMTNILFENALTHKIMFIPSWEKVKIILTRQN